MGRTLDQILEEIRAPSQRMVDLVEDEVIDRFGMGGFHAICQALKGSDVEELALDRCSVGAQGAAMLAEALPFTQLSLLNLNDNNIGSGGMHAIAAALPHTRIQTLSLHSNDIGKEGLEALATALPYTQLAELNLGWTHSAGGLSSLFQAIPRSQLTTLRIQGCNLGANDEEVEHLADTLSRCSLTTLDISNNILVQTHAQMLLRTLQNSQLRNIQVGFNPCTEDFGKNFEKLAKKYETQIVPVAQALRRAPEMTPKLWDSLCQNLPAVVAELSQKQQMPEADIHATLMLYADMAARDGLPVRDFVLRQLPLSQALTWLEARGDTMTLSDFLKEDGTPVTDGFLCQQHLRGLFSAPNLWASKSHAEDVFRKLPEAEQGFISRHQLMATLGQRDAAKQQGRA